MASLRQQLSDLIDKFSPEIERAFREATDEITSEIVLKEVVTYLERRDIEGALAALHIDPSAFRPLAEAVRQAHNAGGLLTLQNTPCLFDPMGARVVFRWDVSIREQRQSSASCRGGCSRRLQPPPWKPLGR
ncbi:hypothetical protein [Rhizobium grahamii]|uniref:hypothetical protein n=1 Tax=Rhizobium grahamii TaxID=1120045 RepID=UPI0006878FA9|nr:hypothetical protein [Rhizobium grahamii]